MEMIAYAPPQAWNDKGMNWSATMNELSIDYAIAIKEAVMERSSVISCIPENFNLFIPGMLVPASYDFFVAVRDCLEWLAPYFINLEYQSTKDDFSDVPKYWSYRDLNLLNECRVCEIPSVGSSVPEMVQWMIRAKNYINKLLVCDGKMRHKSANGSYTEHCTAFATAYTEAKKTAMESYTRSMDDAVFATAHYVTFGAYENNVPVGEGEREFCSTAGIKTARQIQIPPHGENARKFKTCVMIIADTAINQGYPHGWKIMQKIVWDNGEFGINRGVTIQEFNEDTEFDITTSSIPTNTMKPKNKPAEYYATSMGMWGTAYFFKNYGIDGGFKFRP